MASAEFQFDTRIRRYHVPLKTQQHRLRHLRGVSARNVQLDAESISDKIGLYYTLHHVPDSSPFYTSEVITDSLNPTWKDFEPSNFPKSILLSTPYITVKMWTSKEKLLIEWFVFFAGLQFLGKQIPKEGKNFKTNTLIFGLVEGYYGCGDCQEKVQENATEPSHKESISAEIGLLRTSCAFSTLGRIKTFERVISQIEGNASKWKRNIETKLQEAEKLHQIHSMQEMLKIKVAMLQLEVQRQKNHFANLDKQVASVQSTLLKDQLSLKAKRDELQKNKEQIVSMWQGFWELRENLLKTDAQLLYRRKELITDLCFIYPIIQFPDHKGYSIHNVHLPNSENLTGHDEMMISVALGYVCHVILMISQFLNVPLRYEVNFSGSRSTITDHISTALPVKTRVFPLFSKGKDKKYFEYAVYLLNKNIAQLRMLFGMISKELSATLPNLYSLIEQRLSLSSDSSVLPSPNIFNIRESMKHAQNGILHASSSMNNVPCQSSTANSEIEHLKKEMAEMLPNSANNCDSNSLSSRWTSDVNNALCGSLDKGLDDIKGLEKSDVLLPKIKERLSSKKISDAFHHSSYPNLNSCLQTVEENSFSESPQLRSATPIKMWMASGSHTNSEDEPIDENLTAVVVNAGDSRFYIAQDWVVLKDSDVSGNTNAVCIENAILEDFGEDLALRTEQLANRSSSFQMQKVGSVNNDPVKSNPS